MKVSSGFDDDDDQVGDGNVAEDEGRAKSVKFGGSQKNPFYVIEEAVGRESIVSA